MLEALALVLAALWAVLTLRLALSARYRDEPEPRPYPPAHVRRVERPPLYDWRRDG